MALVESEPQYATPVDVERFGAYRITQTADDPRPLYRFAGELAPEAHRYHLYSGWFCPWAHRSTLVVALAGIEEAVSVSYVDGGRDARGWGFREPTGPDPVNGFTLLRDAYEATEPGFDGHVSVPTLWDRVEGRVASNDYGTLDAQLATRFRAWSRTGLELYPADLREEIDRLDDWLQPAVNRGVRDPQGTALRPALDQLDDRLATSHHLLGERLTLADVRLWVTLVRYDVQSNAAGQLGPALSHWPSLWSYARELFQHEAFRVTTRLESFTAPGATVPDWDAVPGWRPGVPR